MLLRAQSREKYVLFTKISGMCSRESLFVVIDSENPELYPVFASFFIFF